ncbi:F510_1955 family glycosylhydrolase [Pseudonocardia broussonetiae]|uniref:Exo-alpha-sialidase n=1 Tax=Pseudonocardia broussonetiae TaxID=2736640 RepID=A0A6M6JKQ3_9PSEU|nr:exo-alpha-sialidase [Pseudonocardia broussonetiae]QJY47815.1 exo-alpha-sialidase [Pseudonocardia broussonetiae]
MASQLTPRTPSLRALALGAAAAILLAGCSAGTGSEGHGAGQPGVGSAGLPYEHVHGLGIDPADDTVFVATHDGLFRSSPGGALERADSTGRDLMGFTITGPGAFLSSGHPGPGEQVANPLGVVESTDAGATWTALGLAGQVDFHALEAVPGAVYGYDATNRVLRASTDGGHSWDTRVALAALDIAADPADPTVILATVQGGVAASRDGGRIFTAPTGPALAYLSWAPTGTVYGIGLDGALFASTTGGAGWQQVGVVPGGRPQALTATGATLLAATAGGVYRSDDDGATFHPLT